MNYSTLRARLEQLERERATLAAALEDRAEACRAHLRRMVAEDLTIAPTFRSELIAFLDGPERKLTIKRWILETLKVQPLTAKELRARFVEEWQDETKANSIRQYLRKHGLVTPDREGRYKLTKKGKAEVER